MPGGAIPAIKTKSEIKSNLTMNRPAIPRVAINPPNPSHLRAIASQSKVLMGKKIKVRISSFLRPPPLSVPPIMSAIKKNKTKANIRVPHILAIQRIVFTVFSLVTMTYLFNYTQVSKYFLNR